MCSSRINSGLPWAIPALLTSGSAAVSAPAGALKAKPGVCSVPLKRTQSCCHPGASMTCDKGAQNVRMFYLAAGRDCNHLLACHSLRRDSASVKSVCTNTPCKHLPVFIVTLFCIEQYFPRLLASTSLSAEGLHFFVWCFGIK